MNTQPQVIEREGKKEFLVLPYEEFLRIKESLENYKDLKELREAKSEAASEATVKLADIRSELLSD
jgi:PHD/YefM family antitoxin component YafN of YafNO toxin-antitoxin module